MKVLDRFRAKQSIGVLAATVGRAANVIDAELLLYETHQNLWDLLFHVCSAFHDCAFVIDIHRHFPEVRTEFRSHMGAILTDSRDALVRLAEGKQLAGSTYFAIGERVVPALSTEPAFRYESTLCKRGSCRLVERVQPDSLGPCGTMQERHAATLAMFDRLICRADSQTGLHGDVLLRYAAALDLMYRRYEGQGAFWVRLACASPDSPASSVDVALEAAWALPLDEISRNLAT